jgi:inner membrane protein
VDSITQFVLGAALGECVAGKKAGNKALFWGGVAGTIPDLDIVFSPLFTELENLSVHRGFSHSLVFGFLAAPVFGWLVSKIYRKPSAMVLKDWVKLFFWGIFTHPLLDAFTLYGTQLFLPFSDYRVALNTISIVDPGYTLPLLLSMILVMVFRRRKPDLSFAINKAGLVLSSVYLILTIFNKWYVERIFSAALKEQRIAVDNSLSNPVLFSNLLWYCVARNDSNCYIGYYSLLQESKTVSFESYQRNTILLNAIKDKEGLEKLQWFSKNFYVAEMKNDTLCFYDVRFGKTDLFSKEDNEKTFVFYFKIPEPEKHPLMIQQYISREDMNFSEFMDQLYRRIKSEH